MRRLMPVLLAACLLTAEALAQPRPARMPALDGFGPNAPRVGEVAPDFQAVRADGTPHRLYAQRGHWTVLEFVLEGEPLGAAKQDTMKALRARYPSDSVAFWLIVGEGEANDMGRVRPMERPMREEMGGMLGAQRERLRAWEARAGDNVTVLTDGILAGARRPYGALANMTWLIDPQGRVAARWAWNDPAALERALDEALGIAAPSVARAGTVTVAPERSLRERSRLAGQYREAVPALRELRRNGVAGFLSARDRDGDGFLSAAELGVSEAAFQRLDHDRDGRIGEPELTLLRAWAEENMDALDAALPAARNARRPRRSNP